MLTSSSAHTLCVSHCCWPVPPCLKTEAQALQGVFSGLPLGSFLPSSKSWCSYYSGYLRVARRARIENIGTPGGWNSWGQEWAGEAVHDYEVRYMILWVSKLLLDMRTADNLHRSGCVKWCYKKDHSVLKAFEFAYGSSSLSRSVPVPCCFILVALGYLALCERSSWASGFQSKGQFSFYMHTMLCYNSFCTTGICEHEILWTCYITPSLWCMRSSIIFVTELTKLGKSANKISMPPQPTIFVLWYQTFIGLWPSSIHLLFKYENSRKICKDAVQKKKKVHLVYRDFRLLILPANCLQSCYRAYIWYTLNFSVIISNNDSPRSQSNSVYSMIQAKIEPRRWMSR